MTDTSYRENWWDRWQRETGQSVPKELQVINRLGLKKGDPRRENMRSRKPTLRLVVK